MIKKRERTPSDKWHLDEMTLKVNSEPFILWRAVDHEGIELDDAENCFIAAEALVLSERFVKQIAEELMETHHGIESVNFLFVRHGFQLF